MKQEEVSMVDEILSTPQGRAMMKLAENHDWLMQIVGQANTLLIDASCYGNSHPMMNMESEWFTQFQLWRGMAARTLEELRKQAL